MPNTKKTLLSSLLIILCSLSGCASTKLSCPPPKALHQVPPPEAFSKCLREIVAVGKGQLAQISAQCSTLLAPPPTE